MGSPQSVDDTMSGGASCRLGRDSEDCNSKKSTVEPLVIISFVLRRHAVFHKYYQVESRSVAAASGGKHGGERMCYETQLHHVARNMPARETIMGPGLAVA